MVKDIGIKSFTSLLYPLDLDGVIIISHNLSITYYDKMISCLKYKSISFYPYIYNY